MPIEYDDVVICPRCGGRWRKLVELVNVRSIGLSLMANCPECGENLVVNVLWHKAQEISWR